MSARRNLWLFLPYQIASLEGLSQGLYLVWLLQWKHLSPEVAVVVLGAGSVALTLLEVPTGMLADRFGHRGSLIAGSAAQVAGIALFWRTSSVVGLTAGSLAVALGDALRSGADAALLYESCCEVGRQDAFGRIYARAQAAATAVMAGLTLGGGYLAEKAGFDATWIGEVGLCALGLLLALAMAPVPPQPDPEREGGTGVLFKLPPRHYVADLILPATVAGLLVATFEMLVQATWPPNGSLLGVTAIVAVSLLTESLGSLIATRPQAQQVSLRTLGIASIVIALAGMDFPVAALWALAVLQGWSVPLRTERIQRLAQPHERAQAESWAGMIDMVSRAVLLPLAATTLTHAGEPASIAAMILLAVGAWLSLARRPPN